MRSNLTRRHFTKALFAAATVPRRMLALPQKVFIRTPGVTRRFAVFSLFEPERLLIQSADAILIFLDGTSQIVPPHSTAIDIEVATDGHFTINCNNSTHIAKLFVSPARAGELRASSFQSRHPRFTERYGANMTQL